MIPQPVSISTTDFDRIRVVVKYVENMIRLDVGPDRDTHHPGIVPFMYGYCANGATGASNAVLGTGSFHPCSINGATLSAINSTSYAFTNAGGAVNAAKYGVFGWCQGTWTAVVFPC